MGANKRRRGIGVKIWLIDALQEYAQGLPASDKKKGKKPSHTTVANKIWQGKIDPVKPARACWHKKRGEHSRKGVSMPEWLWLAIKAYAEKLDETWSHSMVAAKILLGRVPPVPKECIEIGLKQARERESEREAHGGNEPPHRSAKGVNEARREEREAKKAQRQLEREAEKREKEKKRAQRAEEKAVRAAERKRAREGKEVAKRKEKEEQNGSAVSTEQEELKEWAGEKLDERGIPLSKGQPIDEEGESKNRIVNPDDDFFGGVFNM